MTLKQLRETVGLRIDELATVLWVDDYTLMACERYNDELPGLAGDILRGIQYALDAGADATTIGRQVRLGFGPLIYYGLMAPGDPIHVTGRAPTQPSMQVSRFSLSTRGAQRICDLLDRPPRVDAPIDAIPEPVNDLPTGPTRVIP